MATLTKWELTRKILFWSSIVFGALLIILIAIAAFFEERIARAAISELKKVLKTELTIENARLSLVWNFPKASLYLQNVQLKGLGSDKNLLNVGTLALKCDILGLLTGEYKFRTIDIADGELFIQTNKKGIANYDVFASSDEIDSTAETSSDDLHLSIDKATLKNVIVRYIDEPLRQDVQLNFKSALFSGSFTDERYTMTTFADMQSDFIKYKGDTYLKNKIISYDASINIDNITQTYTFKDIRLVIDANEFKANGSIAEVPEGTNFDLTLGGKNCHLGSLLALMPERYIAYLQGFESEAELYFDAEAKGVLSPTSTPAVVMDFGLEDGRLSHPDITSTLQDVNFKVHFSNKNAQKQATFEVENFQANFDGQPIGIAFSALGTSNPYIQLAINGTLPLASIFKLVGSQVTDGNGYVSIENLTLKGNYEDMITPAKILNVQLGGAITFDRAMLNINTVPFEIETGTFSMKDNVLGISNFVVNTTNNHFALNGSFANILPVLLSDSLNSQQAELVFNAALKCPKIDVDELITLSTNAQAIEAATSEAAKDSLVEQQQIQRAFITQFLRGKLVLTIMDFKWGRVLGSQLNGLLEFENNNLNVKGMKVDAMGGNFELNSRVSFKRAPFVEAFLDCHNIDVQQFFAQCENFGQDNITDQQIRGRMNALIKAEMGWDIQGDFLDNQLKVLTDMELLDGELINVELFESLSQFVKTKDLQHIRFTNLKNQFRIENRTFYMPAMFIRSNAANFVISGKHDFDQVVDYKIKINAGQVLASKFKKYNPDMEPQKARQRGIFNMYFRVLGDLDTEDYQVKMGKKDVKKELEAELQREMVAITNTLKAEFGEVVTTPVQLTPLQEPNDWQDLPDYGEQTAPNNGAAPSQKDLKYIDNW